jgi:hypothetical protein
LPETKTLAYELLFSSGISQLFKWQHARMATSAAENKATSNEQWHVTATKVATSAADIKAMSNDQWADAFKAATVSRLDQKRRSLKRAILLSPSLHPPLSIRISRYGNLEIREGGDS